MNDGAGPTSGTEGQGESVTSGEQSPCAKRWPAYGGVVINNVQSMTESKVANI